MPIDSLEAATLWRVTHAREGGFGHKSGAARAPIRSTHFAEMLITSARIDGDDPEQVVARARGAEKTIHVLLRDAVAQANDGNAIAQGALAGLLRIHGVATKNRLDAERRWAIHCLRSGRVAPIADLETRLEAVLGPIASQLRNFSRNVAASANPQAPAVAERAIAAALAAIQQSISGQLLDSARRESVRRGPN